MPQNIKMPQNLPPRQRRKMSCCVELNFNPTPLAISADNVPANVFAKRRANSLAWTQDEALEIFSKYQTGFARRLKKSEAINMLMTEFKLNEVEAQVMFQAFDKDSNDILSLWEFRQFYQTIGTSAHTIISMFHQLEGDHGILNIEKAFDAMRDVESGKGKLTDEEIAYFLKTTAGEAKQIDLNKFINMMCRLKVYKG